MSVTCITDKRLIFAIYKGLLDIEGKNQQPNRKNSKGHGQVI